MVHFSLRILSKHRTPLLILAFLMIGAAASYANDAIRTITASNSSGFGPTSPCVEAAYGTTTDVAGLPATPDGYVPCGGNGYFFSKSKEAVFYRWNDDTVFVTNDLKSFRFNMSNDDEYARDASHVFFRGKIVESADPNTFQPLVDTASGGYTRTTGLGFGRNSVFYRWNRVPGIDMHGTMLRLLTPMDGSASDFYVGLGGAIYYVCEPAPPVCQTTSPLTYVTSIPSEDPKLTVRGMDDSGIGLRYATDQFGDTFYRGKAYNGGCGFNSTPCITVLMLSGPPK